MMHTTEALYGELRLTNIEINKQIAAAKRDILKQIPVHVEPREDEVYRWKNSDGSFVLAPLLAAKAQCLMGMATLKAAEKVSR